MIALMLWMGAAVADEPCGLESLGTQAEAAESAFVSMDVERFFTHQARVQDLLACLEVALTPEAAAAVHRVEGLAAFVKRDNANAIAAWRSVYAVYPELQLDDDVAPEGHPLRNIIDQARETLGTSFVAAIPPKGAILLVDGTRSAVRPEDRPAILQLVRRDRVSHTVYVPAWGSEPAWTPAIDSQTPFTQPVARSLRPQTLWLAGAAAAVAGGAGVGFASSQAARNRFQDPATPYEDLDGLYRRANALAVTGQVGMAMAGGIAATAVTFELIPRRRRAADDDTRD